ncbi:MAG: PilT/PilU family type 4a pilus ATPase [Armatimonadota bacterium]|nr:type IV pili twitching motility protein PilT [Armatimonadota bacterium]
MDRIHVPDLLDRMIEVDGSDLHMLVGEPPTVRSRGRLVRLDEFGDLTPERTEQVAQDITPSRSMAEFEQVNGADYGFAYEDKARFRVSLFRQKGTVALNMRLIPNKLRSFEELGLPASVQKVLHAPRGLFLVTGPTGSGKTTTLATMIDYMNTNRETHIITIEDPIEYYHNHKKSVVTQREVGNDVPTFDQGIVKALRQDPDIILVGEMRDLATISAAITAAETGHLVFSTLHTTSAARTIDRITDVFPYEQQEQIRAQLAGNLIGVLSQLLLPKKDGSGRIAIYELMFCTPAIQHNIREKKTHAIYSTIQTGQQYGMQTMDASLWDRFSKGLISQEKMMESAAKPDELQEKLRLAQAQMAKGQRR